MPENAIQEQVILEDEVLRDGLQMESRLFSLEEKENILRGLIEAHVQRIQIGSFVHPKLVPQMADTDALVRKVIGDIRGVVLTGLLLNRKGLERALSCGLSHASMSVSASDTHSRRNTNQSAEEALAVMTGLIAEAKQAGLTVRGGVQCAFGCAYEGTVPEERVLKIASALTGSGADELNLADTAGMGNPRMVRSLVLKVRELHPRLKVSLHLHDTRGLGLANMFAGYEEGVRMFDVCAGGLGGCPFIPGAAGNVPTEDAVHMFERLGVHTGIDVVTLSKVIEELEGLLSRRLPGHMSRVLRAKGVCA